MIDSNKKYLVVARHGQSFANRRLKKEKNGIKYSLAGSDASIGLTARGKNQARNSGNKLQSLFSGENRFRRMYANRFERVRQSGRLMRSRFDYSVECVEDKRLEKRSYGAFWNLTYRGVQELYPDEYAIFQALGPLRYRPPGGENYNDLFERVENFCDEEALASFEGNQLVVTSSAVMLAFRRLYAGLKDAELVEMYESMHIGNGDFDVYEFDEQLGTWKLKYIYACKFAGRPQAFRAA
jgi:broad specificity phosphatase PhoE